jgi:hypothetical protein
MVTPFIALWVHFLFITVCILLNVIAVITSVFIYIIKFTAYITCIFVDFMLNLLTTHNLKSSAPQNIF